MRKKCLAAAASLLCAAGFAVAQEPYGEVRMSTDPARADSVMQRAEQVANGQNAVPGLGDNVEATTGTSGMAADASGGEASSGVRMSTNPTRVDDIIRRAEEAAQRQMPSTSGAGNDAATSLGPYNASTGATTSDTADLPVQPYERDATSGSTGADGDSSITGPGVMPHERSGFGRMAPPEKEAGTPEVMRSSDPTSGWGRMAPPESSGR